MTREGRAVGIDIGGTKIALATVTGTGEILRQATIPTDSGQGFPPLVTGEDGRAVIEVVMAAYESTRTGSKVALPFQSAARKPIDLWWSAGPT
jgi:predicted NBD/HSP70 family sugar kinase